MNAPEDPDGAVRELKGGDLRSAFGAFDFATTAELEPASLAALQLRARSAARALLEDPCGRVLVLRGSELVDNLETARELLLEVGAAEVRVIAAAGKDALFGRADRPGLLTGGVLALPVSLFLNHPAWLCRLEAVIREHAPKIILCGDAGECAALSELSSAPRRWPHADLVLEFSARDGGRLMGRLAADIARRFSLPPFSAAACELLCVYCARQSGDRRWLVLPWAALERLCREAGRRARGTVGRRQVLQAPAAADFRANYLAEALLREYRDRQILIATSGQAVGQINGLSVIETPGSPYEYGEPVRITATLRAGGEGDVIDIERKAELAGQIHAKAMMIINGFLTRNFGTEQPLPVSASLVFEQSYSEIDGDSASLTGLCAVISAFADVPVRQDLAVTGAVDQFGDVQPVGGVNEKIEGFFRLCRLRGLTGTQGVIIPAACVNQLVLRDSVVRAVERGLFHIYTVDHVRGAVRLLMSLPWGESEDENTLCGRICRRLDELASGRVRRPWWRFWRL